MNFAFYLLGTPDGYNQYPLDNTADLFRSFHEKVKSNTQLTILRNDEIVYYVYTRNLPSARKDQYFGMVIAINGSYLSHIGNVFSVFEQLCSSIALRGKILKIDSTGKIQFVHSRFIDTPDEIETTVQQCRDLVETNLHDDLKRLPEEYMTPFSAITINYDDQFINGRLRGLLKEYNCIHFTKAESDKDGGYIDLLVTRLYEENRHLKEQYKSLIAQKKQYKIVIALLVLLLGGGVAFYMYAQNRNRLIEYKTDQITNLNETIIDRDNEISSLNRRIHQLRRDSTNLSISLESKVSQLYNAEQRLDNLRKEISNSIPTYIYFPSWTSTNYHSPNSISSREYYFYANNGDMIHIPFFVSSESGYDFLTITVYFNGQSEQILRKSGSHSNMYVEYSCSNNGVYRLVVQYSKDSSGDYGNDHAGVNQFYIYRPYVNRILNLTEYSND